MSRDVEVPMGMPDHLPECERHQPYYFPDSVVCICDRLRACEARVRTAMHTAEREEYLNGLYEGRNGGFAAGLSAARDAVAALAKYPGYDLDDYSAGEALAAIDALRGES